MYKYTWLGKYFYVNPEGKISNFSPQDLHINWVTNKIILFKKPTLFFLSNFEI